MQTIGIKSLLAASKFKRRIWCILKFILKNEITHKKVTKKKKSKTKVLNALRKFIRQKHHRFFRNVDTNI